MSLKGLSQPEKRIVRTVAGALLIVAVGVCVVLALSGAPAYIVVLVAFAEFVGLGFLILAIPMAFRRVRELKAKRTAELGDLAKTLGLKIDSAREEFHAAHLAEFNLFKQGSVRGVENIVSGTKRQVDIALIDFTFTTGGGNQTVTHKQSVVYLASPALDLPQFLLRPESVFDRIGAALGFNDIDFPNNSDFSRRYLLKGKEEIQVRSAFTLEVLTYFETKKTINVEAAGNRLIVYRHGKSLEPGPLMELLREGTDILELFARD